MAREDIIAMSQREIRRLHLIQQVLEKKITQQEVAGILQLSSRQIRRIVKRIREAGEHGICHQGRGKPSNQRIPKKVKEKILAQYREKYADFGPTLASEKLSESKGTAISKETLRQWLIAEGLWKRARKDRSHRQWRERKGHWGEMIQVDGSHHDWLEGRGPGCVLMAYIDDATNHVYAKFYHYEGTLPAMESFLGYIQRYGIPQILYLDRHSTYQSQAKPTIHEQLEGILPMSQFERAVGELGVEVIHANSPQAKGRIERLFRTLQDRLVKEMRLLGVATIEGANTFLKTYLPVHNMRFCVLAAKPADLHRPIPKGVDLKKTLCIKTERALRNDATVAHHGKLYQIEEKVKAKKVFVEERMDGQRYITDQGRALKYKEITTRPVRVNETLERSPKARRAISPPADHPWRRPYKTAQKEWALPAT